MLYSVALKANGRKYFPAARGMRGLIIFGYTCGTDKDGSPEPDEY